MKHKEFVEEYNPLSNELVDYPTISINYPKNEDYTIEPTERDELFPPIPPIASPPLPIYTTIPTEIAHNPISLPTRSMSYSFFPSIPIGVYTYAPSITNAPSVNNGIYSYAPFSYQYKSGPPASLPPASLPPASLPPASLPPKSVPPSNYNISYTQYPTYNPSSETYTPTCVLTYSPSYTSNNNNKTSNTTAYSYYSNDKYNTIVFGMATGLGSFCFCVIFTYVYRIYASKKYKLQKIQKNSLKREYESLNDIRIDYNSQF